MVIKKTRPKKKSVEVNRVAPTKLETQTRRPSEIERINIMDPATNHPMEYSSLKCRRLTSSNT
jgi:hypothetical protein